MAFDPSTAQPVPQQQGFDPNTATPVQPNEIEPPPNEVEQAQAGLSPAGVGFREYAGVFDTGLAVGSAIGREVGEGLYGIAGMVNPFDDVDSTNVGDKMAEFGKNYLTYDPASPEGRRNLTAMSKALEPLAKVLETAEKASGDLGYDIAGPIGGAVGAALPTFVLEMIGLGAAVKGKKIAGAATAGMPIAAEGIAAHSAAYLADMAASQPSLRQNLADVGQASSELGKDLVAGAGELMPKRRRAGRELRSAEGDMGPAESAGYRLDDRDRLRVDPEESAALDNGWDNGDVASIRLMNQGDRGRSLEMLTLYERAMRFPHMASQLRPYRITGDSLMDRYNFVVRQNRQAGRDVRREARNLENYDVDLSFIGDEVFPDLLAEMDITMTPAQPRAGTTFDADGNVLEGLELDFSNSTIRNFPNVQRAVEKMRDILSHDGPITGWQAHKAKKELDEIINWNRRSQDSGFSQSVEHMARDLRREIDDALDGLFPAYDDANTRFRITREVTDRFDETVAGRNFDYADERLASDRVGSEARKIISNYSKGQSLPVVFDDLDDVANQLGGRFSSEYRQLVNMMKMLENRIGAFNQNSFQAKTETGTLGAMAKGRQGIVSLAEQRLMNRIYEQLTPEKQQAIDALRVLLQRQGPANRTEIIPNG